jgi:hypothetical protein
MKTTSDGSTASYYELPKGCTELQDLISYRNLNAQDGEIFRAIYRKGLASHSDALRDAKKVLFYATAEVKRLEATVKESLTIEADADGWIEWPGGECPVEDGPTYEIEFGDGERRFDSEPSAYDWSAEPGCSRKNCVIAYRIHKAGE